MDIRSDILKSNIFETNTVTDIRHVKLTILAFSFKSLRVTIKEMAGWYFIANLDRTFIRFYQLHQFELSVLYGH